MVSNIYIIIIHVILFLDFNISCKAYHTLLSSSNYKTPNRGTSTGVNTDITIMLQQQQAVLTKILQKQELFEEKEKRN